jgi:phenylacetate-CoA ligase
MNATITVTPGHFDTQETRAPSEREADLLARLPNLLHLAQQAPGWADILRGIDPASITSRAALAQLPVTRKSDFKEMQANLNPFGGLNCTSARELTRIFMSPGPIFDPQGRRADWAGFARALHALGARPGHLIQNCFSYHFTPGAFMVEAGAAKLGCTVLPAGSGQSEMQVTAMHRLRPEIYAGTPSFLKIILEHAQQMRLNVSSLQYALVSGEALPASLRQLLNDYGVRQVLQVYGLADVGCVAYESATDGVVNPGLVLNEDLLIEIVRPGTGDVLPDGEVGEVLVTSFNPDYPLLRFGTGDLSAVLPGQSSCGRTNVRLRGWLGRADQTTKVRGMFVQPQQVAEIVARHRQILKARLVVSGSVGNDDMVLHCEVAQPLSDGEIAQITGTMRDVSKLRGSVQSCAPGSLPNDGIVIEDSRDYG